MASKYSDKLRSPQWQRKRLQVLDRDNWTCQLCNDTSTELHVHHKKYTKEPWDAPLEDLTSYCKHCHSIIESIKSFSAEIEILKLIRFEYKEYKVFLVLLQDQNKRKVLMFDNRNSPYVVATEVIMLDDFLSAAKQFEQVNQ